MKELEAMMTEEMNHVTVSETLVSNLKPACKRSCVEADDDTIASRVALRKTRKKFDENMQVLYHHTSPFAMSLTCLSQQLHDLKEDFQALQKRFDGLSALEKVHREKLASCNMSITALVHTKKKLEEEVENLRRENCSLLLLNKQSIQRDEHYKGLQENYEAQQVFLKKVRRTCDNKTKRLEVLLEKERRDAANRDKREHALKIHLQRFMCNEEGSAKTVCIEGYINNALRNFIVRKTSFATIVAMSLNMDQWDAGVPLMTYYKNSVRELDKAFINYFSSLPKSLREQYFEDKCGDHSLSGEPILVATSDRSIAWTVSTIMNAMMYEVIRGEKNNVCMTRRALKFGRPDVHLSSSINSPIKAFVTEYLGMERVIYDNDMAILIRDGHLDRLEDLPCSNAKETGYEETLTVWAESVHSRNTHCWLEQSEKLADEVRSALYVPKFCFSGPCPNIDGCEDEDCYIKLSRRKMARHLVTEQHSPDMFVASIDMHHCACVRPPVDASLFTDYVVAKLYGSSVDCVPVNQIEASAYNMQVYKHPFGMSNHIRTYLDNLMEISMELDEGTMLRIVNEIKEANAQMSRFYLKSRIAIQENAELQSKLNLVITLMNDFPSANPIIVKLRKALRRDHMWGWIVNFNISGGSKNYITEFLYDKETTASINHRGMSSQRIEYTTDTSTSAMQDSSVTNIDSGSFVVHRESLETRAPPQTQTAVTPQFAEASSSSPWLPVRLSSAYGPRPTAESALREARQIRDRDRLETRAVTRARQIREAARNNVPIPETARPSGGLSNVGNWSMREIDRALWAVYDSIVTFRHLDSNGHYVFNL